MAMQSISLGKLLAECMTIGDKGTRTPDLLGANEALSQLSYVPLLACGASKT